MTPFTALTADDLLALPPVDTTPVPVELPRIGRTVYVRRLTARGYAQYAADLRKVDGDQEDAVVLAHALGTPGGERLFLDFTRVPVDRFTPVEALKIAKEFNQLNTAESNDELRGK